MSKSDEIQILISMNKVLLEHGHTTCLHMVTAALRHHRRVEQLRQRPCSPQGLKYLFSGLYRTTWLSPDLAEDRSVNK